MLLDYEARGGLFSEHGREELSTEQELKLAAGVREFPLVQGLLHAHRAKLLALHPDQTDALADEAAVLQDALQHPEDVAQHFDSILEPAFCKCRAVLDENMKTGVSSVSK